MRYISFASTLLIATTSFRKLLLYSALLLLTQCSKCKKDDPTPDPPKDPLSLLPPETQTGAGTFGCLINSQLWTPAGNTFGGPLLSAEYYSRNLYVYATRPTTVDNTNIMQAIQIEIDSISAAGTYNLYNATSRSIRLTDRVSQCSFITDKTHSATVEITRFDLVNRIVSGRFSFTLETSGCGQMVVTNGRFDSRF